MSELRLPPEDMADIDRQFWDTVDMERRIFEGLAGGLHQLHEPQDPCGGDVQSDSNPGMHETAKA